jgi:hypothetical protein
MTLPVQDLSHCTKEEWKIHACSRFQPSSYARHQTQAHDPNKNVVTLRSQSNDPLGEIVALNPGLGAGVDGVWVPDLQFTVRVL